MAAPDLLEPLDEQNPSPASKSASEDLRRARLEKAKALSLKRKADSAAAGGPPPKVLHESPDSTFGIEFEP